MSGKAKYYYLQANVSLATAISAWVLALIFFIFAIADWSLEIAFYTIILIGAGLGMFSLSKWFRETADKLAQQPHWEERK